MVADARPCARSIRRATSSGRNKPLAPEPIRARSESISGASGPRSQRATGMPNPFLGRSRIEAGSLSDRRPLQEPLGLSPRPYLYEEGNAGSNRRARRRGTAPGLPARRPCSPGRPWRGCRRAGRYPDTSGATESTGRRRRRARRPGPGARPRRRTLGDRPGPGRSPDPRERPEPALMGQGRGLARPPEELLELEVEADVAVVDRQLADRRAGQRTGRAGELAETRPRPARPRRSGSRPVARRRRRRRGRRSLPPGRTG